MTSRLKVSGSCHLAEREREREREREGGGRERERGGEISDRGDTEGSTLRKRDRDRDRQIEKDR